MFGYFYKEIAMRKMELDEFVASVVLFIANSDMRRYGYLIDKPYTCSGDSVMYGDDVVIEDASDMEPAAIVAGIANHMIGGTK